MILRQWLASSFLTVLKMCSSHEEGLHGASFGIEVFHTEDWDYKELEIEVLHAFIIVAALSLTAVGLIVLRSNQEER